MLKIIKNVKIKALFLLIAMLLIMCQGILFSPLEVEAALGPNLVNNGEFESESLDKTVFQENATINTINTNPNFVKNGTKSLKITQTDPGGSLLVKLGLITGKKYTVSFWIRLGDDSNTGNTITINTWERYHLKSNGSKPSKQIRSLTGELPGRITKEDGWVFCTGTWDYIETGETLEKWIKIANSDSTYDTWYIDDFSVCEVLKPTLVSSVPQNGAVNVALDTDKIELYFSDNMDSSTMIAGNIKVNNSTALVSNIVVNPLNQRHVTVKLNSALMQGMSYTVSMSNLKNTEGEAINPISIVFSAGDIPAPEIVSSYPANNAKYVPKEQVMCITFDSDMDETTLTAPGNITVNNDVALISNIKAVETNKRFCNIFFTGLESSTQYTVKLKNIKSTAGKIMPEKTITFTTDAPVSTVNLIENSNFENVLMPLPGANLSTISYISDSGFTKDNYALKVISEGANNNVNFSAKFINGTKYYYSFYIRKDPNVSSAVNSLEFYCQYVEQLGGQGANLTPDPNKICDVPLSAEGYTKVSGTYTIPERLSSDNVVITQRIIIKAYGAVTFYLDDIVFTAIEEAPIIQHSVPENNASMVSVTDNLELIFSNRMDSATITNDNIRVNGLADMIDTITQSSTNSRKYIVKLDSNLPYYSLCTLDLVGLKDEFGQAMEPTTITFITANSYTIGTCEFYKNYGTPQQEKITDGKLTKGVISSVVNNITNDLDEELNVKVISALYKGDNLVKLNSVPVVIGAKSSLSSPVSVALDIDDLNSGGYTLEMLIWDGFTYIRPLTSNVYTLSE